MFIPIVSLTNNLRSHYTFNASCFGMVFFSYVIAKKMSNDGRFSLARSQ